MTEHTPDCAGDCGTWLAAGTPSCQPYPCQCEKIDDDPPQWKVERARRTGDLTVFACDPYISKKGYNVGRWTNRCACWGQRRERRPEGCCAHHEGNPRYLPVGPDGRPLAAPVLAGMLHETIPPDREAGWQAPHERVERSVRDVAPTTAYADALGIPVDVEPAPYVRRWSAQELHCACPTPWDHLVTKEGKPAEKGIGYHCCNCHCNFRNVAVASAHQRNATDDCRPPETIQDTETGRPVLRPRAEGQFVIWG